MSMASLSTDTVSAVSDHIDGTPAEKLGAVLALGSICETYVHITFNAGNNTFTAHIISTETTCRVTDLVVAFPAHGSWRHHSFVELHHSSGHEQIMYN